MPGLGTRLPYRSADSGQLSYLHQRIMNGVTYSHRFMIFVWDTKSISMLIVPAETNHNKINIRNCVIRLLH